MCRGCKWAERTAPPSVARKYGRALVRGRPEGEDAYPSALQSLSRSECSGAGVCGGGVNRLIYFDSAHTSPRVVLPVAFNSNNSVLKEDLWTGLFPCRACCMTHADTVSGGLPPPGGRLRALVASPRRPDGRRFRPPLAFLPPEARREIGPNGMERPELLRPGPSRMPDLRTTPAEGRLSQRADTRRAETPGDPFRRPSPGAGKPSTRWSPLPRGRPTPLPAPPTSASRRPSAGAWPRTRFRRRTDLGVASTSSSSSIHSIAASSGIGLKGVGRRLRYSRLVPAREPQRQPR